MKPFTHPVAQEWILSGRVLSSEEMTLLSDHLAGCAQCRDFADFHEVLLKEVPKAMPTITHSGAELRKWSASALANLRQRRSAGRFFHGTRALALGFAGLVLVALLAFLIVRLIPEGQRVPAKPGVTPSAIARSVTPIPDTATATSSPPATPSPNWKLTFTPMAETDEAARQQTGVANEQTQIAGNYQTSTAIVGTLQAAVTPSKPQSFISPDGKFKAEVIIYGCAKIQMNEERTYSYEILKISDLMSREEWTVETELLYCEGVGAGGLGGLFWSTNSRYFYYTTARSGVPDGSGGFGWMRPASRFDVTTGEKLSLNGLEFSPDRSKAAAGDKTDLVVWDLFGDEIARFPRKDFITDPSINAWLSYFTWSPDGKSLAYIIRISSNMTSDVLLANLDQKQSSLLLVSSTPEFGEVHWKDQNHLSLVSWQNPSAIWEYDLTDKSLIPPPENTATPSATPTETITLTPTFPPAGIFAIKFYPPLVLDYSTDQWVDKSEYSNMQMMVNFLQNRELESCVIEPMGPSGFWPESMIDKRLGSIDYQEQLDQKTDTGDWISYYFAISAPPGIIDNEIGTAHFFVKSSPVEANKCRVAAEDVLATLHSTY